MIFSLRFWNGVQADVEISSNDNSLKYRETVKVQLQWSPKLKIDQISHCIPWRNLANQVILSLFADYNYYLLSLWKSFSPSSCRESCRFKSSMREVENDGEMDTS